MADLGAKAQSTLGLTPGTRFFSCYPFAGMNTQDTPPTIDDREFVLNENWFHLGNGNLRTAWDVGASIYTAPAGRTIVSFYYFSMEADNFQVVFLDDGTAVQVNTANRAQTILGTGFYRSANGQLPAATQWGSSYLLIANRNTANDFWAWDGSLLYTAGTAAPNGVVINANGNNYTVNPTITAYGGSGTGMAFSPTVQAGGVVAIDITNPGTGYEVGDVVQLAFSGGGSDTSAILTASLNAGGVGAVNVTAGGTGYTSPPAVAFTGGGGSGAAGTAIIGSGVSSIAVTNGGSGYTTAPAVSFSGGGGSGAEATATVVGETVTAVTVTNPGSGYTSAPTVAFSGPGTTAAATASIDGGIVTGVTITNPGTGYTNAPAVGFSGGGGSSAAAVALLNQGSVSSVTVVNGGSGFLYAPNVTFVGGGGAGAAGIVQLTGTSIARINVVAGGQNYAAVPTIIFSGGGGGSGAAATAVIANGQVVQINLTNGGSGYTTNVEVQIQPANYGKSNQDLGTGAGAIAIFTPTSIGGILISDAGLHYTSAPAVVLASGANNSAYATVALMPFGVSGSTMESYQQRLWIANPFAQPYATISPGGTFQVSAPELFIDFATSDGGVTFSSTDSFLQTQYIHFQQSNGYLYAIGDGSVSVISSVNTSGTPTTTTFNYQPVDPNVGASWRDSVAPFSRTIVFANEIGVFGIYGGAATKLSDKMNAIFDTAIFPPTAGAIAPTAGTATIHSIRHYFVLMTILDPATNQPVNKMLTWNEKEWFLTSQTVNLTYIGTQQVKSEQVLWGTDGTSLYPLFQTPSTSLTKRLFTKYYGGGQSLFIVKEFGELYMQAQDNAGSGISITVDFLLSGLAIQSADPNEATVFNGIVSDLLYHPPSFPAAHPYWPMFGAGSGGVPFVTISAEMTTTSADFTMSNMMMAYRDVRADR